MRNAAPSLLRAVEVCEEGFPGWSAATTLAERARRFAEDRSAAADATSELTRFRLERWRAQSPFNESSWFERRLAQIGIDESAFESLLGDNLVQDNANGRLPTWARKIHELYSAKASGGERARTTSDRAHRTGSEGFLALAGPLATDALAQVEAAIRTAVARSPSLGADVAGVQACLGGMLDARLLPIIGRVCVLELNSMAIEDRLAGASATERFEDFVTQLADPLWSLKLLRAYPVLCRHLATVVDNWIAATTEWVGRLADDWPVVAGRFAPDGAPGELVAVEPTEGDLHGGGRGPVILVFRSGVRVVYKPRSLALDAHFQSVVAWLDAHGQHPQLRRVEVVDRGAYGWTEFIPHRPCTSRDQLEAFFQRQGSYLAVLYVLGSSDFHRENVIAEGQHPVLVDLETLFLPGISRADDNRGSDKARRALADSVLRVGLLPRRVWGSDPWRGIDLSGLAGDAEQYTPFGVPHWDGIGTDRMHIVRKQVPLGPATNRPILADTAVDAADFAADIVAGFERTYRLILNHRESLLAPDGPLALFENDDVRVVLRPTRTYSVLLQEGCHPDFLSNAVDRDRLFDLLWATVPYAEHLEPVVEVEQADLRAGDVPRFMSPAGSKDLRAGSRRAVADYFQTSGLQEARDRVGRISERDLRRQSWLVRASLATASKNPRSGWQREGREPMASGKGAVRARALNLARSLGQRLGELAFEGPDDAAWIGLTTGAEDRWSLCPVRTDFYDGLPGVAMFLSYLGTTTRDERFSSLARKALGLAGQTAPMEPPAGAPIGGFTGYGGLIYAYCHLAPLLDAPELLTAAEELVDPLAELVTLDVEHDIIGGAAGCIAALLCLYECRPSERVLQAAISCGERLLATATPFGRGLGWNKPTMAGQALAGFAHGAAGESWALLRLAERTGEKAFEQAAWSAIEYERTLFSHSARNWRDVRNLDSGERAGDADGPRYTSAWCHGAPGIGLARLDLLRRFPDETMQDEVAVACDTTMRTGFGLNHSLCHGDLGNVELLTRAATTRVFRDLHPRVEAIVEGIVTDIESEGPRCGIPLHVESPGLMTGLAGIGFGLLRIADPEMVPCVLLLEPPIVGRSRLAHRSHG